MPKVSQEHLERRRQQILDAAIGCFARQGFHATSMQDIFAAAGLSAGAVYRYFPSKTGLIRAIAAEALAESLAAVDSAASDAADIPGVLASVVAEIRTGRMARLRPVLLQVWAEATRDPEVAEELRSSFGKLLHRIRTLLDQLAAQGQIPADTDTAAAATLIYAILQGYGVQLTVHRDVSPEQVRAAAAALLGHGER